MTTQEWEHRLAHPLTALEVTPNVYRISCRCGWEQTQTSDREWVREHYRHMVCPQP